MGRGDGLCRRRRAANAEPGAHCPPDCHQAYLVGPHLHDPASSRMREHAGTAARAPVPQAALAQLAALIQLAASYSHPGRSTRRRHSPTSPASVSPTICSRHPRPPRRCPSPTAQAGCAPRPTCSSTTHRGWMGASTSRRAATCPSSTGPSRVPRRCASGRALSRPPCRYWTRGHPARVSMPTHLARASPSYTSPSYASPPFASPRLAFLRLASSERAPSSRHRSYPMARSPRCRPKTSMQHCTRALATRLPRS